MDKKTPQLLEKESPFTALSGTLNVEMQQVNQLILERLQSSIDLIPTLAGHLIAAGGKRLRPLLTLAAASLGGYRGKKQLMLATCVEFIHTATLLHDDVVDESHFRRGLASANAVWGNKSSVLVGDFLFSRAFELMVEIGSIEILQVLSSASARIAEGEVLQLLNTGDLSISFARYYETIEAKTARLFEAACVSGGILCELPKAGVEALATYGRCLGIAFQIVDDMLDFSSQAQTLGKTIGLDFKEGKITLPILFAYQNASTEEKSFWERTVVDQQQQEGDLTEALRIIAKHKALEKAHQEAQRYAQEAAEALSFFPSTELRLLLEKTALFTTERSF